jgi:hypothetical protein
MIVEEMECRLAGETEVLRENLPQSKQKVMGIIQRCRTNANIQDILLLIRFMTSINLQ